MKKGERKKQQRALKKRSEKHRSHSPGAVPRLVMSSPHIREARAYPIQSCWVQEGWEEAGIAVVVVARRQPNGRLLFGTYMVDLYCLGLKDTYARTDIAEGDFRPRYLDQIYAANPPVRILPELAHEIIYGGIAYAAQYGFKPHADFRLTRHILDLPEAHRPTGKVVFGYEGKPFYVAGPHDRVKAIMAQLRRTAGEGNYTYLMPVEELSTDLFEADSEEDEE